MGSVRSAALDRAALFDAVDEKRCAEALGWSAVARKTGVSASTIKRMPTAEIVEADGVVALVAWLGRAVSEFVEGPATRPCPLPSAGPGEMVRIDLAAVHRCLDGRRTERGVTWKVVAAEVTEASGVVVSADTLTRYRMGGRTDIDRVLAVAHWIGQPIEDFVRCTDG